MKLVSQEYKNEIKQLGKQLDCKISFNKGKELIELGSNELNLVKTYYKGDLLKSLMKELEVDSNVYIPTGTILKVKLGLLVNGVYEYIDFGEFVVKSSEKQENERSYLIKCYDKMLFSMKPYTNLGISYPISVNEYINTLSLHLGMQFANYNTLFTNSDKLIPKELYLDDKGNSLGYTFRDVFNELSAVVGANIGVIDNKITIIDFQDTNVTIDEDSLKDTNVNFGKKFGPINSVVLNRNEDKIFNKDDTSITNNGLCEIEIKDNQILNGNDRDTYLQEIFNKINGLEFYLNDFESTGITYLEFGDKYNVKIGNQVYNCLMLDDEISIEQGLSEYVVTEEPSTTETDYKKSDKTDIKINRTLLEVDKQSGKITALVNENTEQNEKINTLEITSNETKSTITNIERDLSSANAKIDGVSASFTDFKDNEYIQSIQGLQDQIDGAIQFWNGQEIPTLNNYPANEWISENDKINHIADIYTVIEDINGEMKQGKSYRFDKVQGTWQWIELTDNELSAVQKIAQDALNKANTNEQEVGVLKQTTSELVQTTDSLVVNVNSVTNNLKNNYYTKTQTNAQIQITDDRISNEVTQIEDKVTGDIKTQNTKISKIEQDVGDIKQSISEIADITTAGETSYAVLDLSKVNQSEPIGIKIRPINEHISYLYPNSNLFPSNNLYAKTRTLRFYNKTTNKNIDYELPTDLLFYDMQTYDEFILDYDMQICKVIKRVQYNANGSVSKLAQEQVINYTYPTINLTNGDYTISLLGYNTGYLSVRLMAENIYTTQFATKIELNSSITQTANSINLEVAKKVGKNEVVSSINQTPEKIKINANKIEIGGVITAINNETLTTIDGDKITSGSIKADQLDVNSITADKIQAGAVNSTNVSSDIITTKNFSAQKINADNINAGTIKGRAISGGSVSGAKISGGSININRSGYYFNMGLSTSNPNCSGLNVGNNGISLNGSGISGIGSMRTYSGNVGQSTTITVAGPFEWKTRGGVITGVKYTQRELTFQHGILVGVKTYSREV